MKASRILPFLLLTVRAFAGEPDVETAMGHFTGVVKPSVWEATADLFSSDDRYCKPISASAGAICESTGPQDLMSLMVTDAKRVFGAASWSALFHAAKTEADYKAVLGIPKDKPVYKIGPQDINVDMAVARDFPTLPLEDQKAAKAFADAMSERASHFMVRSLGPQGEVSMLPLDKDPHIFVGSRINDVFDENGQPLHAGWLWNAALKAAGGDPVKAMRFVAYRGVEPNFRIKEQDGAYRLVNEQGGPGDLWPYLPESLSGQATLPQSFEQKVMDTYAAAGAESQYINGKNYHIYAAAYVGCLLAAKGHGADDIAKVEVALAEAYRDITFRHKNCESAHPPASSDSTNFNTSDDAIELLAQLKRDDENIDLKVHSLKNLAQWSDARFEKAQIKVLQWLIEWRRTALQHEAGARWGAKVCAKH